jgi:hypothetical protein
MSTAWSPSAGRHIEVVELEQFRSTAKPSARFRRAKTAYAQLDLKTLALVCKITYCQGAFVWAFINYEAWRTKSRVVEITNDALKVYGIHRNVKRRALATFEQAGLITVERKGKQAVKVAIVAWPDK